MDFSFSAFWSQLTENPLLMLAVILTFGVILVNGWTDAPNAIATCVVTRCMSARAAILMAAVFNFLGVFIMSLLIPNVAGTVMNVANFNGISPEDSVIALSASLFAIVVWATLAWVFGIPTSESHALIAGLTGGAIALNGVSGIIGSEWLKVLIGIGVSVGLGFGLGWLVCKGVELAFFKVERRKTEPLFRGAQIAGAAGMAFMHGAQDGQKFMGVIILSMYLSAGISDIPGSEELGQLVSGGSLLWLMLLCSLVMALGTSIGGKKIIKSVGMDMVKLEKHQGFSADLSSAISLLFCSVTGLPVSTTHAKTTSIMGVGAVRRLSAVNFGVVKEMALTWILTFPGCGLIGFFMTKLFLLIF